MTRLLTQFLEISEDPNSTKRWAAAGMGKEQPWMGKGGAGSTGCCECALAAGQTANGPQR